MAHARLSPSNHRWPNCPGSIREEAAYPDESGDAAIDGTGSHLLLEICLNTRHEDVRAEEWLNRVIGEGNEEKPEGWLVDRERCDRVQMALDYIARRRREIKIVSIEAESQSSPGYYLARRDDWWGTVDITIRGVDLATGQKIIEVIDYKDGRGWVSEKDNSQLISYACGKLGVFIYNHEARKCNPHNDPHLIRMTIIQPRTAPPVRYSEMQSLELWDKGKELAVKAAATDNPAAPLVSGKHCTWCKHGRSGNCAEKNRIATEGLSLMSDIATVNATDGRDSIIDAIRSGVITPASMTGEQIAAILDASSLITKLIDQVKEEGLKRVTENATSIPGYGLGTGRGSNAWIDDEEVVAKKLKGMRFAKDEIYPSKLVSPAQALKKDGLSDRQKRSLESLIEYKPGKPSIVKAVQVEAPDAATIFGDVAAPTETAPPAAAPLSFM